MPAGRAEMPEMEGENAQRHATRLTCRPGRCVACFLQFHALCFALRIGHANWPQVLADEQGD